MDRAQRWQTIRAIALGIAAVGGVLGLAWFLDSGRPVTAPTQADIETLKKGEAEFAIALQDPRKVKLLECHGIQIYKDPQPPGHPPSAEECAQILQQFNRSNTSSGELTALLPSCDVSSGTTCNDDVFKKVWKQFESETGEIVKFDTASVGYSDDGGAQARVYTNLPNAPFDLSRLALLYFDCHGHYMDMGNGSAGMDAPPRSIIGMISAAVCVGAKDVRLENAMRDSGAGETPAEYCAGFPDDACDRMKAIIASKIVPTYCKAGFAIVGDPANDGLSPEQLRTCYLMTGDFSRLSTK